MKKLFGKFKSIVDSGKEKSTTLNSLKVKDQYIPFLIDKKISDQRGYFDIVDFKDKNIDEMLEEDIEFERKI